MNGGKRGPTLVVVLLAAVLSCWIAPVGAGASGLAGDASAAKPISTGSWGAVATLNSAAPFGTGALVVTFPSGQPSSQYFYVANSGSLAIDSATYGMSVSAPVTTVIESCGTVWNTSNDTCGGSGKATTLLATASSGSSATTTVPVSVGSTIQLRARVTGKLSSAMTATITVTVTRSQAQSAATSNS